MFTLESVSYKDILDIHSMHVEEGKITALIGASGGGKSTVLKLLNKALSPDEGRILYKGRDMDLLDSVAHRRNVIYLNQRPHLFEGTVEENLQKGLDFHNKPRVSKDVLSDMLSYVGLRKQLAAPARQLSGGEVQRLALARVLLLDGDVYLMDEPSSALDDESERFLVETIVDYTRRNNKTLVMVTHSRFYAEHYADIVYTIKDGRVEEVQHER